MTPDPITTAREALEELLLTATQKAADRDACENAVSKYQAVRSIFDHVEKLKAERDAAVKMQGVAAKDWRSIIEAVLPKGPMCRDCADEDGTCPHNDRLPCDPTEEVVERFRRLTSQLEQAEKVIAPFARQAKNYEPDEGDGNHLAWDLGNVVTIGELRAAANWYKDRQAKGEASC